MKEKRFPVIITIGFYAIVGVALCIIFFLFGYSLLSRNTISTQVVSDTAAETEAAFAEDEPEAAAVPAEPEDNAEEEEIHYTFTASHSTGALHVREYGSMEAAIIATLTPGTTGDVLELGPAWSLVKSVDITGYGFNGYLEYTVIPDEEAAAQ